MSALNKKKTKCAKVLLSKGAMVEQNSIGEHPINFALRNEDDEMLKIILNNMINLDKTTESIVRDLLLKHMPTNLGTIHIIVNSEAFPISVLASLLENRKLEEEKKLNLINTLVKAKVTSIPVDNISTEAIKKAENLVQKWNKAHKDVQLEVGQRKVYDKYGDLVRTTSSFTDKKSSLKGEKTITGMQIKWKDDGWISSLKMRYEEDWAEEHETGDKNGAEKSKVLTLKKGEEITAVNTRYGSKWGVLVSLQVETSAGRIWGKDARNDKGDKRGDFSSLGKKLAYISSASGGDKYQLVFHWI